MWGITTGKKEMRHYKTEKIGTGKRRKPEKNKKNKKFLSVNLGGMRTIMNTSEQE
jgi:hypothetical protein